MTEWGSAPLSKKEVNFQSFPKERASRRDVIAGLALITLAAIYTVVPEPIPVVDDLALDALSLYVGFSYILGKKENLPRIFRPWAKEKLEPWMRGVSQRKK